MEFFSLIVFLRPLLYSLFSQMSIKNLFKNFTEIGIIFQYFMIILLSLCQIRLLSFSYDNFIKKTACFCCSPSNKICGKIKIILPQHDLLENLFLKKCPHIRYECCLFPIHCYANHK